MEQSFVVPPSFASMACLDNTDWEEYGLPADLRPLRITSRGWVYAAAHRRAIVTRVYEMANALVDSDDDPRIVARALRWSRVTHGDALWTPERGVEYGEWIAA